MSITATAASEDPVPAAPATASRRQLSQESSSRVWGRALAAVGAIAVGSSAAALSVMQVLPAAESQDPVSTPLSNYALTDAASWFDVALLLLVVGDVGLLGALVLRSLMRIGSFAFAWLSLGAVGLGAIVIFPYRTTVTGQLTITGWLHMAASVLAFGGPPMACLALARRHQQAVGCSRLPGIVGWLGAFALGWFAVLATITVTTLGRDVGSPMGTTTSPSGYRAAGAGTRAPAWQYYADSQQSTNSPELGSDYGLIERGLTAAEFVLALTLTTSAWRGCRCRTSKAEGTRTAPERALISDGSMAGHTDSLSAPT